MNDKKLIQRLEELSMNALPALQTNFIDGWILRFSNGYAKRANSINPLYFSYDDVKGKIENMENIYRSKNLKVVYKLTSNAFPDNLDCILENAGYQLNGFTSVQLLSLSKVTFPIDAKATIYNYLDDKWFFGFCELNKIKENDKSTLKKMLENIVPNVCYVILINDKNEPLACGMGVLEGEYIGLFDIVTNEKYRKQGYAKQLIFTILNWGKKNGAKNAYLQVLLDNLAAFNLYSKLGFKEEYKYWYRIKN